MSVILAILSFIMLLLARIFLNAPFQILLYSFIVTKKIFIIDQLNRIIISFNFLDFYTCIYLSGLLTAFSIFFSFLSILKSSNIRETWNDVKTPFVLAILSSSLAEILTIILVDILKIAYETNISFHKIPSHTLFYLSGFIINISTILVIFAISSSTYSAVKNKVKYPNLIRISYIIGFWIIAGIFILDLFNDIITTLKIFL